MFCTSCRQNIVTPATIAMHNESVARNGERSYGKATPARVGFTKPVPFTEAEIDEHVAVSVALRRPLLSRRRHSLDVAVF